VEGFDVLGEVLTVLEVELVLAALLGGAGDRVAVRGRVPGDGASKLLVQQDARLLLRHAPRHRRLEAVVDDLLASAICAVCTGVSTPFQPNIFVWNDPRWSKGRMYRGRSKPIVVILPP
jgi:hypothetical protein